MKVWNLSGKQKSIIYPLTYISAVWSDDPNETDKNSSDSSSNIPPGMVFSIS